MPQLIFQVILRRKVNVMKKHLATFVYAILAGICIGLGGTVFLRVKDLFAGANIVRPKASGRQVPDPAR